MKGKRCILAILVITTILFMTACDQEMEAGNLPKNTDTGKKEGIEEEIDLTPVAGGQITLALTNFSTLNPLIVDNSSYYHFSQLIFEGLFEFDENLNPIGRLAEDYSISENGKTVSIKLRDKVKWHDGKELTAADVAFTIDAIKQSGTNGSYRKILKNTLASLENFNIWRALSSKVIDEKNIDISFGKSYSNKLEALTFPIVPRHAHLNRHGRPDYRSALTSKDYRPVGTGPYYLLDYENNKNLKLKRNTDYWGDLAYIEEINGRVLADEKSIRDAFETGQVNISQAEDLDWEKYRQNPRIELKEFIGSDFQFLGFNFKNKIFSGNNGKEIRKAIAYGINRQEIIQDIYLYHGTEVDLPIFPDSYLLGEEAHTYGYNIDKSKEILESLGFTLNEEGTYIDKKATKLSFKIGTGSKDQLKHKTIEKIKENLREVGFEIIVENTDKIDSLDIFLGEWTTSVVTDLSPMFHSSMIRKGTNIINYKNKELDKLLSQSLYGRDKRDKIQSYDEIQSIIIEELPYIGLFFLNQGTVLDSKIKGHIKPTFFNIYRGLETCYIPQSLQ